MTTLPAQLQVADLMVKILTGRALHQLVVALLVEGFADYTGAV